MDDNYKTVLETVVDDVFTNMAFLFCDPIENNIDIHKYDGKAARMIFHGVVNGSMIAWLENSIIHEMTTNILGIDDDAKLSDAELEDALKELLNVLVGQFLVAAVGDKPIFDLSVPLILTSEKTNVDKLWNSSKSIKFMIDDRPLIINFHCERDNNDY